MIRRYSSTCSFEGSFYHFKEMLSYFSSSTSDLSSLQFIVQQVVSSFGHHNDFFLFFIYFLSSGGWGKIKF